MSDGLDESRLANLAKARRDPEARAGIPQSARKQGLLPDLRGVELHIVGVGGDDTVTGVEGVKAFWQDYVRAKGARLRLIGCFPWGS